jgi:hypothetical protein
MFDDDDEVISKDNVVKVDYEQVKEESPLETFQILIDLKQPLHEVDFEYVVYSDFNLQTLNNLIISKTEVKLKEKDMTVVLRGKSKDRTSVKSINGVPPTVIAYYVAERLRK